MTSLDSGSEIKALDSKNLHESILQLDKQCEQVFGDTNSLKLPDFSDVTSIVVAGMGGSSLGTHVVKSLYGDIITASLEYHTSYHIPAYVNEKTLVILSSYSGTTEEVLSAYDEAKSKTDKILAICSGGDLGELVKDGKIGGYVFEPKFNPSNQPRMGLGYSILSQILILAKLGFLKFDKSDLGKILAAINKVNDESKLDVSIEDNLAKQMAQKLFCKMPFLFASEHLVGSIHIFANQINENAKSLSAYFALPEANHHLIEGLLSPQEAHDFVSFFLLKSNLYSPRVAKRYDITKTIVEKQGIETLVYELNSGSKIEQVFEFLTLGSWVSFYLAMIYDRDPSPIPNVDFLKSEMTKA